MTTKEYFLKFFSEDEYDWIYIYTAINTILRHDEKKIKSFWGDYMTSSYDLYDLFLKYEIGHILPWLAKNVRDKLRAREIELHEVLVGLEYAINNLDKLRVRW